MKPFDFLDEFGNIDESYIMEAYEMKRTRKSAKRLWMTYLAAALAVALLSVTVYAAVEFLGIADMKKDTITPLPKEAETYVQQQEITGEAQDWSCQLVQTLFDATHFVVTVGISGGDKYIVAPTYCSPADLVTEIGLTGTETLGEYAAKQGKELLFVGADVGDRDALGIAVESELPRSQSDSEMTILVEGDYTAANVTEANCQVYAVVGDNYDDVQRVDLPFKIDKAPSSGERVFKPDKPDAIPGMTVGDATIEQTPLGISIRIPETITDQQAYYEIMMTEFEGFTYGEGGALPMSDGTYCFQASMCQGTVTDTLTVHYYDWDKQLIGTITFHAQ